MTTYPARIMERMLQERTTWPYEEKVPWDVSTSVIGEEDKADLKDPDIKKTVRIVPSKSETSFRKARFIRRLGGSLD